MAAALLLPLLLPVVAAAPPGCDAPVAPGELRARAEEALAIWPAVVADDAAAPALLDAVERVRASIPCVDAPLEPAVAARAHAAIGLGAWIEPGGLRLARASFGVARRLDAAVLDATGWAPSPETARLRAAWEGGDAGRAVPVPSVRGVRLVLDGTDRLDRVTGAPAIWQQLGARGEVLRAGWLGPEDALPTWRRRAPREAWATLGVGVGASLAAGLLGALAGAAWTDCLDAPCAPGRRALAEDGSSAAWALGGLGVALTVGGGGWIGSVQPAPVEAP